MSKPWLKWVVPPVVLVGGFVVMGMIGQSGQVEEEKEEVDTRPLVSVESLKSEFHQVRITGHGEIRPVEKTVLSAQVSGEVTKWHPNFVAGGLVKRGEVLFEIEPDAYEVALLQAESQLAQAEAALIEEQGRADVAKREAKTLPDSKVTDLYLRKPQLLSAKSSVKLAQASVKLAKRDLANTKIVAPYDALVVSRNLGSGQFVSTGMNIGEIYNIETAEIMLPIAGFDQSFLPSQLKGSKAQISTRGNFSVSRPGTIVRDSGLVDSNTRMTYLVVEIEDPYSLNMDQPKMIFGSYVEVEFDGQSLNNIFVLPQELVSNRSVWVLDDENKLRTQPVEVLREEGKQFLISGGLSEGQRVVMTVPEYPQIGAEVRLSDDKAIEKDKESEDAKVVSPAGAQSND